MRRLTTALLLAVALQGCGIKAPPLPPLDEPTPAAPTPAAQPDAGCCRGAKP